jgi:hypothetical protein
MMALVFVIAMFSATNVFAAKTTNFTCTGSIVPVTTLIADANANATAYYLRSDFLGAYDNSQQGVCSDIWSSRTSGGWELDVRGSQRTVNITVTVGINDVAGSGATTPWFSGANVVAKMLDQCSAAGWNPGTMTAGQHFTCPFIITNIPGAPGTTGETWELVMTGSYAAAPETGLVQFTCNSNGSDSKCNDWSIDPVTVDGAGNVASVGTAVARLKQNLVTRKTTIQNTMGDFYLTFHIHVTRP